MTDITYVSWHQTATVLPLIQNWSSAQLSLWPFSSKFWKILTVIIKISWKQDFTATGVVYHRDQWTRSRTHRLPIHLWHFCHPVIIWLNILQHFQWAINKATWGSTSNTTFLLHPHLDSIAASLFVWNWLSWQTVSTRWRDPSNNTDTEARCLVYPHPLADQKSYKGTRRGYEWTKIGKEWTETG